VPTTLPPPGAGTLSRRTAVGGAVALAALSGCTPRGVDRRRKPGARATHSPDVDPDVALAAAVLGDEQAALDRVLATVRRHPGLADVLSGAQSAHQAHVALLIKAVPRSARASASASPSDVSPLVSPSVPSATAAGPRVPSRSRPALLVLARQEDRLGLLGRRSAFAAQSGAFARVLASMAAAAAQQSETLSAATRGRP
jgi:hypothetical protein